MKNKLMMMVALCGMHLVFAAEMGQEEVSRGVREAARMHILQGVISSEGASEIVGFFAKYGGDTDMVQISITKGADLNRTDARGNTALMNAARRGHIEMVLAILTAIPIDEQRKIAPAKGGMLTGAMAVRRNIPQKEVRKLITQEVVNSLVEDHMQSIKQLIAIVNRNDGETAQQKALNNGHLDVAALLDLNNPVSYERIRAAVEQNIKRIIKESQ